jgi:predicted alpha/beta-hydrolase family hydrolase
MCKKTIIKTKTFTLSTYSSSPRNFEKIAIVLPGKLDTKDYPHMKSHVNFLSKLGYFAISFDPPGTWESPGDISLYTMTNYAKAINELIEYYGSLPTVLVGHSRGGSIAMLVGTTNPSVTHIVAIMSCHSFTPDYHGSYPDEKWKRKGYELFKKNTPNQNEKKTLFKLPYSFLEDQIQYDMSEGLSKSSIPKLFIYGNKDEDVEPEVVKTAYKISAKPKILRKLDSDHDYYRSNILIEEVNKYINNFLKSF